MGMNVQIINKDNLPGKVLETGLFAGEGPNLPLAVEDRYTYDQTIFTASGSTAPYATNAKVVKAGPGFLKSLIITGLGAVATGATHLFVYDNTAASGVPIDIIPRPATGVNLQIEFNHEFYTGLSIGLGTIAVATATVTPTLAAVGAVDQAVDVLAIYR